MDYSVRGYLSAIYKFTARKWGRAQMVGALFAALLALALLAIFPGFEFGLEDRGVQLVAAFSGLWFVLNFLFITPYYLWAQERRRRATVEAERTSEVASLTDELRRLKEPDELHPMDMRELALHLHGAVSRFSGIADFQERYRAVDIAVRDALSVGPITATGRPKNWIDAMVEERGTRVDIKREFWASQDGTINWWSVACDDYQERATVKNRDDVDEFYDVAFDRAAVLKRWPADDDSPIEFLRFAELAEGCLAYEFAGNGSHTLSFIHGVRQAARLGQVKMCGRTFDATKQFAGSHPLNPIRADYFEDWQIVVPGCDLQQNDNWEISTSKPSARLEDRYRDLAIADRREALQWLLNFRPTRLEAKTDEDADAEEA